MTMTSTQRLKTGLRWAVYLLILKVTFDTVANYADYLPPDFSAVFLRGRKSEFFGAYQWAFYPHIAAGPISLVLGMIILSERIRQRFPRWHTRLGKLQIACILLFVTPSGLWMSFYAQAGLGVKIGFAMLATATGFSAWFGWRSAMQRDFDKHRTWMLRCYVLLCSAIVTRLIGGAFLVTGIDGDWTYYMAAWTSWLVPLGIFEIMRLRNSRQSRESSPLSND